MNMNLSKLQEIVKVREAWCTVAHGVAMSWTWLSNWTTAKRNGENSFFWQKSWRKLSSVCDYKPHVQRPIELHLMVWDHRARSQGNSPSLPLGETESHRVLYSTLPWVLQSTPALGLGLRSSNDQFTVLLSQMLFCFVFLTYSFVLQYLSIWVFSTIL